MKTVARASFIHDLKKIKGQKTKQAILRAIESVENANSPSNIPGLKSLKGFRGYFRIIPPGEKDYRIGLYLDSDIFEFVLP